MTRGIKTRRVLRKLKARLAHFITLHPGAGAVITTNQNVLKIKTHRVVKKYKARLARFVKVFHVSSAPAVFNLNVVHVRTKRIFRKARTHVARFARVFHTGQSPANVVNMTILQVKARRAKQDKRHIRKPAHFMLAHTGLQLSFRKAQARKVKNHNRQGRRIVRFAQWHTGLGPPPPPTINAFWMDVVMQNSMRNDA